MGYTVFLAEDDLRLRDELSALLERYGYRCLFPAGFEDLAGQILSSGAQLVLLDPGPAPVRRLPRLPGPACPQRPAAHYDSDKPL